MAAPTTDICPMCDEEIEDGEPFDPMGFNTEQHKGVKMVHRDCLLRSVMGGIGHHEDHFYWCLQMHDPDGGRTYRQSAREVAEMVRKVGISGMFPDADG